MASTVRQILRRNNRPTRLAVESAAMQKRLENVRPELTHEIELELPYEIAEAIAANISADCYDDIDSLLWLASYGDDDASADVLRLLGVDMPFYNA